MSRAKVVLIVLALAAGALSGCFGSDDAPKGAQDAPPVAQATEDTGAIEGALATTNLEPVSGGRLALVSSGTAVANATTDERGRFVINGIAPGTYRLQASAVCCQMAMREVNVEAGKVATASLQLELLSADDLKTPYSQPDEWDGMISCAIVGVALCGIQGDFVDDLNDPNDRFMTHIDVNRGIKSLLVGLEWKATGGTAGKSMTLLVENDGCGATECSYRYGDVTGESPLEIRIDNGGITDEDWKWDNIEDNRTLQFRVFPGEPTDVMYQQGFTIYYEAFYWQEAPPDASVIPDG